MNGIIEMYKTVYLGLGTNLGEKFDNIQNALNALRQQFGEPLKVSSIYESEAWGFKSPDSFLNLVVSYNIRLNPNETLDICLSVEKKLGRKEKTGNDYESRIIDIDILFFGDLTINKSNLKIPHPLIKKRLFVLEPLLEICDNKNILNKYGYFLTRLKNEKKNEK